MSKRVLAASLGALLLTSCGGDDRFQPVYPVSGQVLLDGQPVEGLDVRLIPKDKSKFVMQETPLGRTDVQGKFALSTYYTGDGAPAGEYMVAIADPDEPAAENQEDDTAVAPTWKKSRVPQLYQVPQKSGLSATIPERETVLEPFNLQSRPGK